jgi:hypothetical protein
MGDDKRIDLAISALRDRIDEEFRIAERLDAKGRQLFVLAAGFFAVAQAVAFGSFHASAVHGVKLIVVAAVAGLGVAGLVAVGHRLANAEEPSPEEDIDPAKIEEWARDCEDDEFGPLLLVHLRHVAEARHASNMRRVTHYAGIESMARWALIVTGCELVLAIIFRL